MSKKKHCLFQLWLSKEFPFLGYGEGELVEDTELITWEEAVELWEKYKPRVIKQLEDEQVVEMVIWTSCEDNTSYHTDAFHIDSSTEVDNGEFVVVTKQRIDPSAVTMGEPV